MALTQLAADVDPQEVADAISRDGAVIVDRLVGDDVLDRFRTEMGPALDATAVGPDDFSGFSTRRTGALIARSPTARELVMHPLSLGVTGLFLGHATNYQLHLTQAI